MYANKMICGYYGDSSLVTNILKEFDGDDEWLLLLVWYCKSCIWNYSGKGKGDDDAMRK